MKSIKEISLAERPRTLLASRSPKSLNEKDLWAVFLGNGTKYASVRSISSRLAIVSKNLLTFSLKDLVKIPGIGLNKALSIIAAREIFRRLYAVNSSNERIKIINSEIASRMFLEIAYSKKEHIQAIYLDAQRFLISKKTISIGTLNASIIHPRDVFAQAIYKNSASVVIAHNHPSGNTNPSKEDVEVTRDLIAAGRILGIPLIDHLIVSRNSWRSLITGNTGNIVNET